jgi:dihydrofolate reductase
MHFDVVVAVDRSWGIGKDNALPWPRLKGDLARFKQITSTASEGRHNAVIMGRRTWESIGSKALPRRMNIVISRRDLAIPDGVVAVHSLDEALTPATIGDAESAFVIGGAEIYRLAFEHPALRFVYLTRIAGTYETDTQLPDLDARGFRVDSTWPDAGTSEDAGVAYRIERLVR